MAKRQSRTTEHPKILMVRTLAGFLPATAYDEERLQSYAYDSTVEVQLWQRRSLEHLRLYWVVLHFCVDNSENKYGSAEALHSMIKIALGYSHRVPVLVPSKNSLTGVAIIVALTHVQNILQKLPTCAPITSALEWLAKAIKLADELTTDCETIVLPGSIALDKMDQGEFKMFFDRAMTQLEQAGYAVNAFIEESKIKLGHVKAPSLIPYQSESMDATEHESRQE